MDSILAQNDEAAYGPQHSTWDSSGLMDQVAPGMLDGRPIVGTGGAYTDYLSTLDQARRDARARMMDESAFTARDMLNY